MIKKFIKLTKVNNKINIKVEALKNGRYNNLLIRHAETVQEMELEIQMKILKLLTKKKSCLCTVKNNLKD